MAQSRRILWIGVAACVGALVVGLHQVAATASSYKCFVSYSLYDGLPPGKVRAAGSVDCSGFGGSGSGTVPGRPPPYGSPAKTVEKGKTKVAPLKDPPGR